MIHISSTESLFQLTNALEFTTPERRLILIGGCSRSGKSTIAFNLFSLLKSRGMESIIIQLDSWLLSFDQRKPNSTVIERYECEKIVDSIRKLLSENSVQIPTYDPTLRRRTSENGREVICANNEFIIVEGVIALALKDLFNFTSLKIFISLKDQTRIERLMHFYQNTKGLSKKEAEEIIYSRELEEVPFLNETAQNADIFLEH